MDKSTHYTGGREYTVKPETVDAFKEQALLVMDRVTGELYDPKAKFDAMMRKPEMVAMFKRLSGI